MEHGNQLRNFIGGFSDLEEHFLTTKRVSKFLPLVGTINDKFVFGLHFEGHSKPFNPNSSVVSDETEEETQKLDEILVFTREHLGFFIQNQAKEYKNIPLGKLSAGICGKNGAPVTLEDAESVDCEEPATLSEIYAHLVALRGFFGKEIMCGSKKDRLTMYTKVCNLQTWIPETVFKGLCERYVEMFTAEYPAEGAAVKNLSNLLVTKSIPKAYTKAVFTPLMIPRFFEKSQSVQLGDEIVELSKYCFNFFAFTGFGYKGGAVSCTPWDGMNDNMSEEVQVTLPTVTAASALQLIELSKSIQKDCPSVAKWASAVLGEPHNMTIGNHLKSVKKFFGTHMGIGMLQSQIDLITPKWGVNDMIDVDSTEDITLGQIKMLSLLRLNKFASGYLKTFPQNAFAYDTANVIAIEKNNSDTPSNVTKMYKIMYQIGDQLQMRLLFKSLGLDYTNYNSRQTTVNKCMQFGLWAVYNSSECTQWGNLNNKLSDCAQDHIDGLDSRTYRKWVYELKTIPQNEPGNILGWIYNARLGILTTVAAIQAYTFNLDGCMKSIDDMVSQITSETHKETVRGFLARTKASTEAKGLTSDLGPNVLTTKAYALTKSLKAQSLETSGDFRRLEWYKVTSDDPEKVKFLASNYDLKQDLLDLNKEFLFFYKRLSWISPKGAPMKSDSIIKSKKNYVNAPVAFLANHAITDGNGRWLTSTVDTDISWSKIEIYQIAMDTNMCYSDATKSSWLMKNTSTVITVTFNDILNELIENARGKPVKSSSINNYSINGSTYNMIVSSLKSKGLYEEDEEPQWQCDAVESGEMKPPTPPISEGSKLMITKRKAASDIVNALELSMKKRRKMMDDDNDEFDSKKLITPSVSLF